jgi:hypothetical protein
VQRSGFSLLLALAQVATPSMTYGQNPSDTQRQYLEQQRQEAERQRDRQRIREEEIAHEMLMEDIRKERERSLQPNSGSRPETQSGGDLSFGNVAAGVAIVGLTAAVLHGLFVANRRAQIDGRSDLSTEEWLRDPQNRPGVPQRFDTPDGLISKVCIQPFPDVQTVIYRWDAPNELARVAEISRTATGEHLQFTHATATGLFIYVTKPAPNHRPSDKIYWLAAHRIGMTGCGHAKAYSIGYPKYGGPPVFERAADRMQNRQREAEERQTRDMPFLRTCQVYRSHVDCVCLMHKLSMDQLIPEAYKREYNREEILGILQSKPGAVQDIQRWCKLRF